MNDQIISIIEQHQIELQKVKEDLRLLARKVSDLEETVSFLHILKYDMFISYEISKMNLSEDKQTFRLYQDVNNTYYDFKKKFEEFLSKQYDIERLYKLVK